MRVVVYRPSQELEHACAVFLLGTPERLIEQFLEHSGFDSLDPAESYTPPQEGDPWWGARGFSAAGEPTEDGPSASWTEQNASVVSLQLLHWKHHAAMGELLGAGWWRFLSEEGEKRFLPSGRWNVRSPLLQFLEREGMSVMGTNRRVFSIPNRATITLLDRHGNEDACHAELSLQLDASLDQVACAVLQSMGMYFHVSGVSVRRRRSPESARVEMLQVGMLLMDSAPSGAEEDDLGFGDFLPKDDSEED